MFGSPAFRSLFETGGDFSAEVPVQVVTQEAQNICAGTLKNRVLEQVGQEDFQAGTILEQDVGGQLTLIRHPIGTAKARRLDEVQDRVHPCRQRREQGRPTVMGKLLTKRLSRRQIIDPSKGVVIAIVSDALLVHMAGQAFPLIDVYLNLKWKPALQANVDEPQFGVQIVKVKMQAFTSTTNHFQLMALTVTAHRESRAGFQGG